MQTHQYKVINPTGSSSTIEQAIDAWAAGGWRLAAVISDTRPGYTHQLVFERPVDRPRHPLGYEITLNEKTDEKIFVHPQAVRIIY